MTDSTGDRSRTSEKQLELGTWGAFFIWMGVALFASLAWGVWLLGVGVIVLGAQLVRRLAAMRVETFWLVAGALFMLGGIFRLARLGGVDIPIIPILCVVAGLGLLANAFRRSRFDPHGT